VAAEKAARMPGFHRRERLKKEEKRQIALSGIISYLTAKCGGNVHDRGVVDHHEQRFRHILPSECCRTRGRLGFPLTE
jgi:hypothetical protein